MSTRRPSPSATAREPDVRYPQPQVVSTLVDSCVPIEVLAELSPRQETAAELEVTLAELPLQRQAPPWDAAFLAGQAFKLYRQHSGVRTSPMPDFYIGAHAWVNQLQLLTRNAVRYRRCFPKLTLVVP
jgi:predicted nucleic acid-binding protein